MNELWNLYQGLLEKYGPQGWWPVLGYRGSSPTATGSLTGYHPGDYNFPRNDREHFEICIGAILTQNTAWFNVEKALLALDQASAIAPEIIVEMGEDKLKELIRPSGYFNVKAKKLREFSRFYRQLHGRTPGREELLQVWGIGPETADSMLLYAYGQPEMMVDKYTHRVLSRHGLVALKATYDEIKSYCEQGLPRDKAVYQEFHALLVEHAKLSKGP